MGVFHLQTKVLPSSPVLCQGCPPCHLLRRICQFSISPYRHAIPPRCLPPTPSPLAGAPRERGSAGATQRGRGAAHPRHPCVCRGGCREAGGGAAAAQARRQMKSAAPGGTQGSGLSAQATKPWLKCILCPNRKLTVAHPSGVCPSACRVCTAPGPFISPFNRFPPPCKAPPLPAARFTLHSRCLTRCNASSIKR